MTELNLKEYIFKKVKNFQNNPDLFVQIVNQALKERKLDEEANREELINRLNDINYAEYPLQLIINEAYAAKRKDLFQRTFVNEVGYLLPGTDWITGIKLETKINGMKIGFLNLKGQLKTLQKWSKSDKIHLGIDSNLEEAKQRKINIPYFYKVNIRIEIKDDSRYGHSETLHYLDEIDPQSRLSFEKLAEIFNKLGNKTDNLTPEVINSIKDKFIILKGVRWGQMRPLTHWVKTGKQIAIKSTVSADGTVDINKQLNGKGTTEKVTYEDEILPSQAGQPLIQQKIGSESAPIHVPCFSLSLITESSETRNYINVDVTNGTYAEVKIWLASFNFMLNKIQQQFGVLKKEDEAVNPFANFDNYFRGTPLIIFGRITSAKESPRKNEDDPTQVSIWINASMIIDENFLYLDDTERFIGHPIETLVAEFPNLGIYRDLKDFILDLNVIQTQAPTTPSQSVTPIVEPTKARVIPKDPQYAQKVDAINQETDDRESFRIWVNELTYRFKSRPDGRINQKDLGEDLIMILSQTGNIWNPEADFEYKLTDSSIFDDQQKTLYKWWQKNINEKPQPAQPQPQPVTQAPITQNFQPIGAVQPIPIQSVATTVQKPTTQGSINDYLKTGPLVDVGAKPLDDETLRKEYFQFYVDLNHVIDKNTQSFDRRQFNQEFIRWALKEGFIHQLKPDDPINLIIDAKKAREFNNGLNKFFFDNKKPASYYWQENKEIKEYWDLNTCQSCNEQKLVSPSTGCCFECDNKTEPAIQPSNESANIQELRKVLEAKTVSELRDEAKVRGISGYSKMKKNDLIGVIIQNETPISAPAPEPIQPSTPQPTVQAVPAASDKPANLTEKEWQELKDLEASIIEWKKAMPTMNFTFEELFANYKGFFPPFVDESHKPIIDQMLEKINQKKMTS